jgi:hypothetical protein
MKAAIWLSCETPYHALRPLAMPKRIAMAFFKAACSQPIFRNPWVPPHSGQLMTSESAESAMVSSYAPRARLCDFRPTAFGGRPQNRATGLPTASWGRSVALGEPSEALGDLVADAALQ